MIQFLKKYSPFFVLLLLVWLLLELFYRNVPNNYSYKYKNVVKSKDNIELLLLGNSHVLYGLNPNYFEQKTFNLSNISQTLYFDKLLFDSYHSQFTNLKTVVISVEYTSLFQVDDSGEDIWRKYYYHHFMDLDVPTVSNLSSKTYSASLINSFQTSVRHINTYFTNGTILDVDSTGFGYNYDKKDRILISSVANSIINKHENQVDDISENVKKIEDIIQICKQKKYNVVLLSMPVSKDYSSGINQSKKQLVFKTLKSLANKNDHVFYLNLFEDNRFSNNDFYDADHLHSDGAVKCSKIVSEFVSNL